MMKKTLALVCIFLAVVAMNPVPNVASPAPAAAAIGTMSAIGTAEVRAVRTKEATLFSGDIVRSLQGSYVRVFLNEGHRIELSSNTDVKLAKESATTKIAMLSGRLAFASSPMSPLQLNVQSLTVLAEPGESGSITSASPDLVSVAVVKGPIEVRNSETGEWFLLRAGTTTFFGLHGREPQQQPQQPPPPPPGQEPATIKIPQPSESSNLTKILIFAGLFGSGAVIAAVLLKDDNVASPSSPR